MYQCKVDVDMLNAVKRMLAGVSSVSPSSESREHTNKYNNPTLTASINAIHVISCCSHHNN